MSEQNTNTPEFEQKVNEAVDKMVKNDKGAWELPKDVAEDLPQEVLYAARLEKRFRDTQAGFTKSRQELKKLETVNNKLTDHLIETATGHLSKEQKEELEDLKLRDPDTWRSKLNEYEQESKRILQEKLDGYKQEGEQMSEMEMRKAQLEAFTEQTGIELNDDIIADELPASYSKQLESGKITFDQFLEKAQAFLTKEKVIDGAAEDEVDENGKPKKKKSVNLSKLPGGHTPTETAQSKDLAALYKNDTY